uniref:Uncharacterized protein n=1 Tax=Rhizophora mucronata TaxID=61149 RepID=A0A2P2J3Q7_RHIMU
MGSKLGPVSLQTKLSSATFRYDVKETSRRGLLLVWEGLVMDFKAGIAMKVWKVNFPEQKGGEEKMTQK